VHREIQRNPETIHEPPRTDTGGAEIKLEDLGESGEPNVRNNRSQTERARDTDWPYFFLSFQLIP